MQVTNKEMDRIECETRNFILRLRELGCDTARVFVTAIGREGQTNSFSWGEGNWHAQFRLVESWVRGCSTIPPWNMTPPHPEEGAGDVD